MVERDGECYSGSDRPSHCVSSLAKTQTSGAREGVGYPEGAVCEGGVVREELQGEQGLEVAGPDRNRP
jgi:hypothetical protein